MQVKVLESPFRRERYLNGEGRWSRLQLYTSVTLSLKIIDNDRLLGSQTLKTF